MSDIMNNNLKTWRFAYDNDNQIKRVLLGWQTATTYLYNEKNTPNNYEEVLVFDNEKKACITKTLKIIITEFKNIDENLSKLEEHDFVNWQQTHINYFKSVNPNFDENTKVVFKIFANLICVSLYSNRNSFNLCPAIIGFISLFILGYCFVFVN